MARTVTGVRRAVKVVWKDRFEADRIYDREFEGVKRFEPLSREHPGLVHVLQVGRNTEAGYFYYVMELADDVHGAGQEGSAESYEPATMASMLAVRGRFTPRECVRLGVRIAEALSFLHGHQLVHRDVKLANIIFVGGQPRLADIGLVAGLGEARSFVGTDGYIPPEGPGGVQADVYSLGKVLYELATGRSRLDFPDLPADLLRTAKDEDSPAAGVKAKPRESVHGGGESSVDDAVEFAELNAVILRACATDLENRHRTADELRGELILLDAGRSVRQMRKGERRMAAWRRFGVVAAVVGLLAFGVVMIERRQTLKANERAARETQLRRDLEVQELAARRNLYAADMNLAQNAIHDGNYGRAETLLGAYRNDPSREDLRGVEWYYFWNTVKGDSVAVLEGHQQVVSSLALGADGLRIYSGGFDNDVVEWSLVELRELRRWSLPGCPIMSLALSKDGHEIVVEGGNVGVSGRLNLETGDWLRSEIGPSSSIGYSPEGDRLVRGVGSFIFATDGRVQVMDLEYRLESELFESGGRGWFSPDGSHLVTGSWGDQMKVWSWPKMELVTTMKGVGTVLSLDFSDDGLLMAAGTREGGVILWRTDDWKRLGEVQGHGGAVVWSVAFSSDGQRLASGGNDQTVRTWSLEFDALKEAEVYRGHRSEVWAVLWAESDRRLISGGKDGTIRVWDSGERRVMREWTGVSRPPVFSKDETLVGIRFTGSDAEVWDLEKGERVLDPGPVVELGGFDADARTLVVLRPNGVWERIAVADGRVLERRNFEVPEGSSACQLLSQDGRWVVFGMSDGGVIVQEMRDGGEVRRFSGHVQQILAVCISENGERLLTGSADRTARLWELESGRMLEVFEGHQMGVGSLTFAPDGMGVVTGSWDDFVRWWEGGVAGKPAMFGAHVGSVHDIAFAPDGRTLIAVTGSGELKFWNVAAGREAGALWLEPGGGLARVRVSARGRWVAAVGGSGRMILVAAPRGVD